MKQLVRLKLQKLQLFDSASEYFPTLPISHFRAVQVVSAGLHAVFAIIAAALHAVFLAFAFFAVLSAFFAAQRSCREVLLILLYLNTSSAARRAKVAPK